jgi:hypothetical protein
MSHFNIRKLTALMASLEDSDGVARQVDVTNASASATKDHPESPTAEADSKGEAATAADTVSVGDSDGVTPTIQDAINAGKQVGEDITKMQECKAACEHHAEQVAKYIDRNESVPPALASAIKVSLNRYDSKFFAKTVPALESFSAPVGRMTVSLELLDKLKSGAAAVGKGIVEAIKKFIQTIINGWNILTTNHDRLLERLEAANKVIRSGSIKEGTTIDYSGLRSLLLDGEVVGSSGSSVNTLVAASEGLMVQWPNKIVDICNNLRTKIKAAGDDKEALGKAFQDVLGDLGETYSQCFQALDTVTEHSGEASTVATPTLPGNRIVKLTYHHDKVGNVNIIRENFSATMTLKMEKTEGKEGAHEGGKITVPSATELAQGIDRTKALINIGQKRDEVASKLVRLNMAVTDSGEEGGQLIQSLVTAAFGFTISYIGYLNTTITALVGYYEKVAATATNNLPVKA